MHIVQEDINLVSTMASILLAGRIDGIYDVDTSVHDAVFVATSIVGYVRQHAGTEHPLPPRRRAVSVLNGAHHGKWTVPEAR